MGHAELRIGPIRFIDMKSARLVVVSAVGKEWLMCSSICSINGACRCGSRGSRSFNPTNIIVGVVGGRAEVEIKPFLRDMTKLNSHTSQGLVYLGSCRSFTVVSTVVADHPSSNALKRK